MNSLHSIGSILVALVIATVLGPLLGRMATQWFSGRGLSNLLIEVRGAFLPFLLAPLLYDLTGWSPWLIIGGVVGAMQGISVARWIARRTGEWSPSLIGSVALGRSRAASQTARTMARGAVVGTLARTTIQVVLLEAILAQLNYPGLRPEGSWGELLQDRALAFHPTLILLAAGSMILTEIAMSWLLQRRTQAPTTSPRH